MMIPYTAEELSHLDDCIESAFLFRFQPETLDPAYWRAMAANYRDAEDEERAAIRAGRYCPPPPSPDDVFETTPADLDEAADAAEAGMIGGETL